MLLNNAASTTYVTPYLIRLLMDMLFNDSVSTAGNEMGKMMVSVESVRFGCSWTCPILK